MRTATFFRQGSKLIRILVYPNITFQKDLEKDSYIQVIKNQIRLLNSIRDDLFFYLVLPKPIPSLRFRNATPLITHLSPPKHIRDYTEKELKSVLAGNQFDLPTYPPTMRSHFDVGLMKKMLSHNLDFDLVMSHLPEHTHALKNTMYNLTHHTPLFFGYCHWFDVKQVVAWSKDSFIQNITGLLEYDRCFLNTQHQKDLVLSQAADTFNEQTISKLDEILVVQHLGVNEEDINPEIVNHEEKIIVFNHRPDTYKNFKGFMKVMDKLRLIRTDFKVWIPLLPNPNRDWVITDKGDKDWYYKELKKCCVGFSPKQTYGGWSVATTDGMMNSVPYVMYNDTYYKELCPVADFFDTDDSAVELLDKYLSDTEYRNQQAKVCVDWIRKNLIYKNEMVLMSDYIDDLLVRSRLVKTQTKSMKKIVRIIRESGRGISKRHLFKKLGWGRGFKFSPYRRTMMNHPNIFDVGRKEPIYRWM